VDGANASNVSAWSGVLNILLDVLPPNAPTWVGVDGRSISTIGDLTSFFSKTSSPQLEGQGEAGSTIKVVANNSISIETPKKGAFSKTTSYKAAGYFEMTKTSNGIKIELASNYVADTSLPGFALFLTNNPNSLANALQIDAYDDADGAHYTGAFTYNIQNVGLNDYKYLVQWCRPFSILTGKAFIIDK
jgi:hypothetical protein